MANKPRPPVRDQSPTRIAELLGKDQSAVLGWIKKGLPYDKQGRGFLLNAAEVAAWMKRKKISGKVGRPPEEGSERLKNLKIRKEEALCKKYERENAVEEGKLLNAADEQARDVAKILTIRNRLVGLGASLSPQLEGLDGAARQTVVDQAIEIILEDLGKS